MSSHDEQSATAPSGEPEAIADPSDRRQYPRVPVPIRFWIDDGHHTVYLRPYDVSRGGLSLRASAPFQRADELHVRVELPDGGEVHASGEVVWVKRLTDTTEGPRLGARFLQFLQGEERFYQLLAAA